MRQTLRRLWSLGRGRPMASSLLLVLSVLFWWPQHSPWRSAQLELFDNYQQVFPRAVDNSPVVIVEIDEDSLQQLGQWPWPRHRLARLVQAMAEHGALAIGLDLYLPEPDQTSPEQLALDVENEHPDLARALRKLPPHDFVLAQTLASTPSVLGMAGTSVLAGGARTQVRVTPLRTEGEDARPFVNHHPYVLASLPALQASVRGQALLSVSLDAGVVRRIPLIGTVGQQLVPSLALEMLRIASGSEAITVRSDARGVQSVQVAGVDIPTLPNGEVWLHTAHAQAGRYISAADVLAGQVPDDMMQGKLVLLGLTAHGLLDQRATALHEYVPGVELHAQVMDSLFDNGFLQRPSSLRWIEFGLLVGIGVLLIWAVPRWPPPISTSLAIALYALLFGAGYALFRTTGLLFDAASLFASLNIVFGSLLSSVFIERSRAAVAAEGDQR